jgi:hypothetical protein
MQIVFLVAFELFGSALGWPLPTERQTPLWARIAAADLVVVVAFAGAALVTLAATFIVGLAQAALGRQAS